MNIYTLYFLLIICECFGLYFTKKYSLDVDKIIYLILCILFYGIIPIILIQLLKYKNSISLINVSWNLLSTIYGLIIGILIFGEIISFKQWIGVILGIISILFISDSKKCLNC